MYRFYQISYIDDCDDVDKLMGAEWVYHKEVWRSLWQLAELCGAQSTQDTLFTDSEFVHVPIHEE